ncbi:MULTISPECIES: PAS domain-containing protein [unclassified Meiothermus]|uniref:PAS domain-containing protein n=1 Tax=unclassified Meiothermus TaxID=370471 RepID=UPI000D7BADAF|nr:MULTISPECIES: PAS domain-containing protein [unclassified Meiothermus]PZA07733.1 PAS domain-containing sensor histidine kinase [Meiothermus sp. Pnk-1]RYM37503.1 PAS domain S-box protein [Meiothermus sp. PNK-Is4]
MEDRVLLSAVESTFTGVVIADARAPDCPVIYCNPAFVELTGYPQEEVLGRNCRFLQGPATDREAVARVRQAIADGRSTRALLLNYRKDGRPFWNELHLSPVCDGDGNPTHFVGIQLDVTERVEGFRLLERALREWTATLDALPEMVFLTDGAGRLRRCNLAASEFFGLGFRELIDRRLAELFGQEEGLFRGAGGEFRLGRSCYSVANHPLPRAQGGQVHVVRDITAQKALSSQLEWLLAAVEQAADAVVVTDLEGRIESLNRSFRAKTGWSSEEALGMELFALQGVPPEVAAQVRREVEEGRVYSGLYQARRRGGEVYWEEATVSPVREAGGRVVKLVHIQRDVSERRRLEAIAEAVNMAENLGQVFSGLRHELGNPINSAMTALSVLRENAARWPTAQVLSFVERALVELERVAYLLRTLKTFNLEALELERLELGRFLRRLLLLVREDLERKGIQLTLRPPEEEVVAWADPRALHQVLLNLLSNAAEALEGHPLPEISLEFCRRGRRVEVTVGDNGRGMGPEELARLFKPFYTTKRQGSGLGLVISQRLMAGMRGTLSVQSERGRGTRVTLTLEEASGAASPPAGGEPGPAVPAPPGEAPAGPEGF